MFLLKRYLDVKGAKTVFLNLDIEADRYHFVSQENYCGKLSWKSAKEMGMFSSMKFSAKKMPSLLKGIYDMNLPYKFIVSGSGSLELKEKIHESLAGRKRIFELNTISFDEFVDFKTDYKYENNLRQFFNVEQEKMRQFLAEYLNFGGYPRVILEETLAEKKKIIDEIFRSYLEKDISYLLNVDKVDAFSGMAKVLASQVKI